MKGMLGRFGALAVLIPIVAWSTTPVGSDPPDSRPWEWTGEQRIRERYDPERIERRHQRAVESGAHGGAPTPPGFQMIDGRDDPELFFEWELFDALMTSAYGPEPQARDLFRELIEENLAAVDGFEMPVDFWQRLESTAKALLASLQAQRELAARIPEASASEAAGLRARIEELQEDGCSVRRAALIATEKELGREALLRILYQGVAPDTFLQESTADGRGDVLRFVQMGCP